MSTTKTYATQRKVILLLRLGLLLVAATFLRTGDYERTLMEHRMTVPVAAASTRATTTASTTHDRKLLLRSSSNNGSEDATRLDETPEMANGEAMVVPNEEFIQAPRGREPRQLQVRNETGIIVYFLHIPKTGGSTVNKPFFKHWEHSMMVYHRKNHIKHKKKMLQLLDSWENGDAVYYEHHAGSAPNYVPNARNLMHAIRDRAQQRGIPFFAFSLWREPLSFAMSHFNFYHTHHVNKTFTDDRRHYKHYVHPTEQDFLNTTLPSPQCLFLTRTEQAYYSGANGEALRDGFDQERECENSYQAILEDMDWIGTTDRMVEETFPLLRHVTGENFSFRHKNGSKKRFARGDLSEAGVRHVRNITEWDQRIYERVQRDFVIGSHFANYPPTAPDTTVGNNGTATIATQ